ncbi:MAG TPA: deoxyribose-phosphate aldolase [Candidatus Pacearchaeota archaeon]|nr:deoxyribose-phosphate aldolase [Candidatus Parcubacteria bacterium]HOC53385.1 deoxyribose-phosphate aldolase [Candidatus Pacearchaeota archaeon]HQM24367.1 deoxyribose-phosphate aldolase [Candidatus Pacearchaeota archaeon]
MKKPINKYIDHTNIKLNATKEDIIKTCDEAKEYDFRGVCIRPKWVKTVAKELKGTGIETVVLIDDPIGDSDHKVRVKMCKKAKEDGADDLDVVISIPDVKHEKWEKIEKELKEICKIGKTKVIIASGMLTDNEIAKASSIVKAAGGICVKTATEKDPLENRELEEKARHLKIMRKNAPGLLIKASGKIQTLEDVNKMIKAGADIIGSSNGVKIMKQVKKYV